MSERIDRALELLVVWVLLVSGLGLGLALAGHFLAPQVLLASILLTTGYAWWTRGAKSSLRGTPNWRHLLFLGLVGLFFRLPAYHYVLGGQDEGLYVNIAHHIENTGGVAVSDKVLERLEGTPYAGTYLDENRSSGLYVPGVYAKSATGTQLQFQFYHLFPVWMALFDGIFGNTWAVHALTLFALLSILFFYRLALVVSNSPRTALLAATLLAVCPLHAFFSKFPVTEVPTLAFSLIGFTYLAAYRGDVGRKCSSRWLWISALAFGALFVTRISGFMYIPFLAAIALAGAVLDADRQRQRAVSRWGLAVTGLYALSVWYGLRWSGIYARDIYSLSFKPIFGQHWRACMAAIVLAFLLCWFATTVVAHRHRGRECIQRYLVEPCRWIIGLALLAGLALGLYKIYRLGWTHHYDADAWLGLTWGLASSGVMAAKASSLMALLVYLGPLIPVCFLAVAVRKQDVQELEFLRVFVTGFFVYVVTLQWIAPYGPYYARYLLSELVPYMLLLVVLIQPAIRHASMRKGILVLLYMSAVYMGLASAAQLGKSENDGLYASLGQLLSSVGSNDLVLLNEPMYDLPTTAELETPILYTFNHNALAISSDSLKNAAYLAGLDANYDDVYLVSEDAAVPAGFALIGSTRIEDWAFKKTHLYPRALEMRGDRQLYFYLLEKPEFPLGHEQAFQPLGPWNDWLVDGWSQPEGWGTWSDGNHAELALDPRQFHSAKDGLRLTFGARVFVSQAHPRQRIEVRLNHEIVAQYLVEYPQQNVKLAVDVPAGDMGGASKIRVGFNLPDAISPKSLGQGGDTRQLALGLMTVNAEALDVTPVVAEPSHDSKHR